MKKVVAFLLSGALTLGCAAISLLSPTPETGTADCSDTSITDADVDFTLGYGKAMVGKGDWKRSYTVNVDQVYASYISSDLGAVVFINTFALCNAQAELKGYSNEDNLAIMLANYKDYVQVDFCEHDQVLLFQFTATQNGTEREYNINLWFTPVKNPNRALEVMLVFPKSDTANLERYSEAFFPTMTTCQQKTPSSMIPPLNISTSATEGW